MSTYGALYSLKYIHIDVSLNTLPRAIKILASVVSYLVYPIRL